MKSHNHYAARRYASNAFTIVELLIVIVIIAILATITLVSYNGIQDRARKARVATQLADARQAMELYRVENDKWPFEDDIRGCITGTITDDAICGDEYDRSSTENIVYFVVLQYLIKNHVASGQNNLGTTSVSWAGQNGIKANGDIQFCVGVVVSNTMFGPSTSYFISSEKLGVSPYGDQNWCAN